jgi:hypothetical protein
VGYLSTSNGNEKFLKEERKNENDVDRDDGRHICIRNWNGCLDVYFRKDGSLLFREYELKPINSGSSRKSVGKLIRLTGCRMASNKEKKAFKEVKKSV